MNNLLIFSFKKNFDL